MTPPHITELFSDLARVNKNSIVYDNCTGTGGFLISAMKKMIQDAKGDEEKIKEIKKSQLIGTEYQSHIFALAVSNMYIHQDGKTNIINGSCFNQEIIEEVKVKKPTIGFLNPPYKSNKKTDTDELEFILNNLECLVDGGTCIAIIPMQSALARTGKVYELKNKLLQKHTLEAVLSMPDELFINSKVGVVSCIMIFTAHKTHPKQKETYLGYYKDDGFKKRKNLGRIDANGKYEAIKDKWITNFINKKDEDGLSINKRLTADMEWAAEAYMKTNYSNVSDEIFVNTILSYSTFLLSNRLTNQIHLKSFSDKKIAINPASWSSFTVGEIFEVKLGAPIHSAEIEDLISIGNLKNIPYVTRTSLNNGVECFIDDNTTIEDKVNIGNCITVGAEGFRAFYQPLDFINGNKVNILRHNEFNQYNCLFICTLLNLEIEKKFNYGRGVTKDRISSLSIKLPSKDNKPDFEFMQEYIKSLEYSSSLNLHF